MGIQKLSLKIHWNVPDGIPIQNQQNLSEQNVFLTVVFRREGPKRTLFKSWTYVDQISVPVFQFRTSLMSTPCIISHHSLCHVLIFFTLHLAHQSYKHFSLFVYFICLLHPTTNVSIPVEGEFWLLLIRMGIPNAPILFLRYKLSFLIRTYLAWTFHTPLKKMTVNNFFWKNIRKEANLNFKSVSVLWFDSCQIPQPEPVQHIKNVQDLIYNRAINTFFMHDKTLVCY